MTSFATSNVDLPDELAGAVHDHVHSDTKNEVGGVFVGRLSSGELQLADVLPALEAVGGAAQLTFTHETWEHLLSTVDNDYPEDQIVGWYHSHPGHGVFLSSYDQFIHENFFSAPGMVALVVDPTTDDFGWFGWEDGTLTRLGSDLPVDRPDREAIPTEVSSRAAQRSADEVSMDAIRRGVLTAVAALAVFGAGVWWGRGELPEQLQQSQGQLQQSQVIADAQQQRLFFLCQTLPSESMDASVTTSDSEAPQVEPGTTEDSSDPTPDPSESPLPTPVPTPEASRTQLARELCLNQFPQLREPSLQPSPSATSTPTPEPTSSETLPSPQEASPSDNGT